MVSYHRGTTKPWYHGIRSMGCRLLACKCFRKVPLLKIRVEKHILPCAIIAARAKKHVLLNRELEAERTSLELVRAIVLTRLENERIQPICVPLPF